MAEKRLAGNTATGMLKVIALIAMFCDHAGKMLLPDVPEMRMIGRLAFPLYAWCMVVGACYTHSAGKYLLRVLMVGVASQPLYMMALRHTWREPNIFLTLAVALLALWGMREKRWLSQVWGPILALILAEALSCDYGWKGVLLVILLYAVRDSRAGIAAVMIAFCLYWGSSSRTVTTLFGCTIRIPGGAVVNALVQPRLRLQAMAVLATPLMLWKCRSRWKMPAWLAYGIYPAHLVILWLLETVM